MRSPLVPFRPNGVGGSYLLTRYGSAGRSPHLFRGILDTKMLESVFMRISEAARRLGTSARMLRYREDLGLLPQVRDQLAGPTWSSGPAPSGPAHRQFSEADLEAVAAALELERRYDISPAALAFGLRVLAEPPVRAAVADLGRRLGRIPATPAGPWTSRRNAPCACCPAAEAARCALPGWSSWSHGLPKSHSSRNSLAFLAQCCLPRSR